jgi:hypothetical protein
MPGITHAGGRVGRRRSRSIVGLAGAVGLLLATTTIAHADNLVADGDAVTSGEQSVSLGEVCAGQDSGPGEIELAIKRQGNYSSAQVFKASSLVTVHVDTADAGLTVNVVDETINIPADWSTAANNSVAGHASAQVVLNTNVVGPFSGRIDFAASGVRANDGDITRTTEIDVTATVLTCAPSDSTPPVITTSVSGTLGDNGWYTSDVLIEWTVTDAESDVTIDDGCVDTTISADTAGQTLTCVASSAGGTSSESVTIKRDATPPSITGTRSPTANENGWNNDDVTVTFECDDDLSGIASCTDPQSVSAEGAGQSVTGTATDQAGNTATTTVDDVNIDKTAPTVALVGGPADGGSYYFGSVPEPPTCTASDALSGLDSDGCSVSGYSSAVGEHTVKATATDRAGNVGSDTADYEVLAWTITGFHRPVDMGSGVFNVVKAGSTVPLKFEVFAGETELTDTSVVSSFMRMTVDCSNSSSQLESEMTVTSTGGTSLRYDTTDGQFIQNWKTPSGRGSCHKVTLTTQDGSSITALFKLR